MRHDVGTGHGKHGSDWTHPDADEANITGAPRQDLRHALGLRFKVRPSPVRFASNPLNR
jgi:hypothetical protein